MLSRREREHMQLLNESEVAPEVPTEPRGARATVGTVLGANVNVRTRMKQAEDAAEDAATPAQRAHNERAALIDMYANAHAERQKEEAEERARNQKRRDDARAKTEHERKQQEYARLKAESDARALREYREGIVAQVIADDIRAQIKAIMLPNLDILDECRALVESWGGNWKTCPDSWKAAVDTIRKQK